MLTLAQMPLWATSILVVFYVLISVVMILAVLIQRPQGGGLSTAFGAGAGSGQTAFGTKIGDALTVFTISVFVLFLGSSIALVYILRPDEAAPETPAITNPDAPGTGETGGTPTGEGTGTPSPTPVEPTPVEPAPTGDQPATNPDTPVSSGGEPPATNPEPTVPPTGEPSPEVPPSTGGGQPGSGGPG